MKHRTALKGCFFPGFQRKFALCKKCPFRKKVPGVEAGIISPCVNNGKACSGALKYQADLLFRMGLIPKNDVETLLTKGKKHLKWKRST